MKRDFKGIWIPREIWIHPDLTITEKNLWAEIHSLYDRHKKGCYASNNYLASFFNVTTRYISKMINKLIKLNLMELVSFDGNERIVRAIMPPEDLSVHPFEEEPLSPKEEEKKPAWNCSSRGYGTPVPGGMELQFQSPIYIDNKEDNKEYTPYNPSNEKPKKRQNKSNAGALGVCVSDDAKKMVDQLLALMKQLKATCKMPEKTQKWLESAQKLIDRGLSLDYVLKVAEWGLKDNTAQGDWKGWAGPLWHSKNKLEYLYEKFDLIETQMTTKTRRKFAPSSDDQAALRDIEEAFKRAI